MKIAFVNQPFNPISPPVETPDSLSILTYELAHRLARSHDVIVYAMKGRSQKKVEKLGGIEYRRVSVALDRLRKPLEFFDRKGWSNIRRPFCSSSLYYFSYIFQIAMDLRRQNCDIVHIHTFAHFVPILRRLNPDIKIVLHMNDHSLTQRDRERTSRQLKKADLLISASNFLTEII